MADASSGRNEFNSGSDSAIHHRGTAADQYKATPTTGPAVPTVAPNGSAVRDQKPVSVPGSAVR